jgi:hypothetical protein
LNTVNNYNIDYNKAIGYLGKSQALEAARIYDYFFTYKLKGFLL